MVFVLTPRIYLLYYFITFAFMQEFLKMFSLLTRISLRYFHEIWIRCKKKSIFERDIQRCSYCIENILYFIGSVERHFEQPWYTTDEMPTPYVTSIVIIIHRHNLKTMLKL